MNVVNLVILLVSVVHVGAHEVQEVVCAVVLLLGAVGVQAMKDMVAGVTVLVVKDPHQDVAALHLLSVVGATADPLHPAMLVVLHLMLMEIDVGLKAGCCAGRT
ncbi:hypothetical protein SDJN02_06311, partial [Cucurbita argyrosperma subsp. argyrosperma]